MIEQLPDLLLEAIRIDDCRINLHGIENEVGQTSLHVLYTTETVLDPPSNRIIVGANVQYSAGEALLLQLHVDVPFVIPNLSKSYRIEPENNEIVFRSNLIPDLLSAVVGTVRGVVATKIHGTRLADYPLPLYSLPLLLEANQITISETGSL